VRPAQRGARAGLLLGRPRPTWLMDGRRSREASLGDLTAGAAPPSRSPIPVMPRLNDRPVVLRQNGHPSVTRIEIAKAADPRHRRHAKLFRRVVATRRSASRVVLGAPPVGIRRLGGCRLRCSRKRGDENERNDDRSHGIFLPAGSDISCSRSRPVRARASS
jgi:hypothetical protein